MVGRRVGRDKKMAWKRKEWVDIEFINMLFLSWNDYINLFFFNLNEIISEFFFFQTKVQKVESI